MAKCVSVRFLLLNFLCNNLLIYLQQLLMQTKYILLHEFTICIVYMYRKRASDILFIVAVSLGLFHA